MNITETQGDVDVVICAGCGGGNLHVERIDHYGRIEDNRSGLHTTVRTDGRAVTVDDDMRRNPSARRDGLIIYFRCEFCCDTTKMSFAQHKGQTIFEREHLTGERW